MRELPSGAALVTIPEFGIPSGWSAESTTIRFLIPVGYPGPAPDCFWANSGLRLAGGQLPQASQDPNPIPEVGESGLWFSWHVTGPDHNWNPSRDTLETYVSIIAERFRRPQ
jgi:hypothetical protein